MAQNRLLWTGSDRGAIGTHLFGRLLENDEPQQQIADSGTYADDPDMPQSSAGAADDTEINGAHGSYTV